MLNAAIIHADYQTTQLQGGTIGDVQLISGMAETATGDKLPYRIVLKSTKKWERYWDPGSWRKEYDFYKSDFGKTFTDGLHWPECYLAEINEDETETRLWLEYIDGVSGLDLTVDMYERAAYELGRFQGKLYAEQPPVLQNLTNLSKTDYPKNFYLHYRSWPEVYDYIRDENCELPKHICQMLIDFDRRSDDVWTCIQKLPVVLCHRDFWVTNIFSTGPKIRPVENDKIILIDWDTAGWGHMGEDLASLIADEADVENMIEIYQRCIPAYYKGFSEYVDISHITDNCVREFILLLFGYRLVEWYKFVKSDGKMPHLNALQKIYEML
ncbi:MAG: aminoglycoside phosphotransferase family protein [Firmicutes bacterium]|nr:aminoglycoside phosphotransferase family protein [Bacillota bacterium]